MKNLLGFILGAARTQYGDKGGNLMCSLRGKVLGKIWRGCSTQGELTDCLGVDVVSLAGWLVLLTRPPVSIQPLLAYVTVSTSPLKVAAASSLLPIIHIMSSKYTFVDPSIIGKL